MQKTLLLLTVALSVHIGLPKARAEATVSVDFFYDQLSDYGDWVEVGDYGYCWQPRDVDEDWRPYSDGRWAHTDAGWTWQSEEPYGWAVYHYGRWSRIAHKGWVWIPGTEWAPAWVSWRRSPRHVGWAPLPPEASFRRNVGLSGWVDSYYDIGPDSYRFVETRNFGAPQLRTVFVEPRENVTIINQTTNITNITYVNNVVNNGGPRFDEISRVSADPIRQLKLDRRVEVQGALGAERGEQLRTRVEGDSLRVFAPGFNNRAAAAAPRKVAAKIEKAEVNRGWADAGPAADVEKLRSKVKAEAKIPKALPPQPKFEKLVDQAIPPQAAAKDQPVATPGEKPGVTEPRDGRKAKESPVIPAEPVATSEKPKGVKPSAGEPIQSGRKGERAKQPKPPLPPPVEPLDKKQLPKPVQQMPPAPENPRRINEGSVPPTPAPRPDAPEPPKPKVERSQPPREAPPAVERTKPKMERPQPPREAPPAVERTKPKMERPQPPREAPPAVERTKPKMERPSPPNVAPAAPNGEAGKPKHGKGKPKDDKSEGEVQKAQ